MVDISLQIVKFFLQWPHIVLVSWSSFFFFYKYVKQTPVCNMIHYNVIARGHEYCTKI